MEDDINEDDRPEDFRSGELRNENPYILKYIASNALAFIQVYGWLLVILVVLAYYIKTKINLNRRVDPAVEAKKYDNEEVRRKHQEMDDARLRMQMAYNQQARAHMEQMSVYEEEKRRQRIEEWERQQAGLGYQFKPPDQPGTPESPLSRARRKIFNPYTSNYNPLMGPPATGSSYRPPPRRSGG